MKVMQYQERKRLIFYDNVIKNQTVARQWIGSLRHSLRYPSTKTRLIIQL